MALGTKRQLCAVLVLRRRGTRIRQSGTVELVNMCADCHEISAPLLEWSEWSAQVAADHFISIDIVETLDATRLLVVISIKFRIE